MKKRIIVGIITTIIGSSSVANYRVQFPLEATKGGILDTGSIIIKENDQTPVKTTVCLYSQAPSTHNWKVGKTNQLSTIVWDGVTIATALVANSNSYDFEGATYTKSIYKAGNAAYEWYEVCQTK